MNKEAVATLILAGVWLTIPTIVLTIDEVNQIPQPLPPSIKCLAFLKNYALSTITMGTCVVVFASVCKIANRIIS